MARRMLLIGLIGWMWLMPLPLGATIGFDAVIQNTEHSGMFAVYENNRTAGIGNFITTDFVLTAYGRLLTDLLTDLEEQTLAPTFQALVRDLSAALPQPPDSAAQQFAHAYVAVLHHLLTPDAPAPPTTVVEAVEAELTLIRQPAGIAVSPVTGIKEDYSQYQVRGKYTRSETLQRYFRALTYAGRMSLLLQPSPATGMTPELADTHTAAALLLSRTIQHTETLRQQYETMQARLNFLAGPSDDLTVSEYAEVAADLNPADARSALVAYAHGEQRWPRIVSSVVEVNKLEPGQTPAEVLLGWRLFGQGATPESEAFHALTYDRLSRYTGPADQQPLTLSVINGQTVRGFPTALDIMAGLGSAPARSILTQTHDDAYEGYGDQLTAASQRLRTATYQPSSLSTMQLRLLGTVLHADSRIAPLTALNTALGSWIQHRHALLLYAKQSYTAAEKSLRRDPVREAALIEPADLLYSVLIDDLSRIGETLEASPLQATLTDFQAILTRLRGLTLKQEADGLELAEIAYVNNVDMAFSRLLSGPDAPLVVDLHTEPNSQQVLEAGLGYPLLERRVFKEGNELMVRGGRFNCYQFTQPLQARLSDEAWQALLGDGGEGKAPVSWSRELLQLQE